MQRSSARLQELCHWAEESPGAGPCAASSAAGHVPSCASLKFAWSARTWAMTPDP